MYCSHSLIFYKSVDMTLLFRIHQWLLLIVRRKPTLLLWPGRCYISWHLLPPWCHLNILSFPTEGRDYVMFWAVSRMVSLSWWTLSFWRPREVTLEYTCYLSCTPVMVVALFMILSVCLNRVPRFWNAEELSCIFLTHDFIVLWQNFILLICNLES